MSNSPLGQYAPLAATVTAFLVIGAYVIALLFGGPLNIDGSSLDGLQAIALIAIGAVFGSAVAVNGWKQPLEAVHKRVDTLEIATGVPTHESEIKPEA